MRAFLLTSFIILNSFLTQAQEDSIQLIYGLPITGDDTADDQRSRLHNNVRRVVALPLQELPDDLVRTLDGNDIYSGWRDTVVYLDETSKLYIVPVRYEGGIRTFRMNARGRPVAFDDEAPLGPN